MLSLGREDLIRSKPLREKKPKAPVKIEQVFGCSDDSTDYNTISHKQTAVQSIVKSSISCEEISKVESRDPENMQPGPNHQSTGDLDMSQGRDENKVNTDKDVIIPNAEEQQSKNIFSSLKNFFKL